MIEITPNLYDEFPFLKKITLFLRQNHYLFWKITLMDVTIIVPIFFLIAYTLDRCTSLETGYAILIAAAVCAIIEHFRIKFRRIKTYRVLVKRVEYSRELLKQYTEAVESTGTEEDKQKVADMVSKFEELNQIIEQMADIAFMEDVLGLSDEE